jgi:DNA modification methylase
MFMAVKKTSVIHLNRQIPPEAHTPMYNFHKYWSRKTWNVVGKFIENYCPQGKIVFDPFGGSGVSAIEALKHGRKAIICDLNPIATEIIRLTIKPISLTKLDEAFKRIETKVKKKILELYNTKCRKCKTVFPFDCAIWKDNNIVSIRYYQCPNCGTVQIGTNTPILFDDNKLKEIEKIKIKEWYPKNKLYHANGNPFKEKQKFESIDELFTKRNLYALAILMAEIDNEPNKDLRDFLKIGFTSIVHLCTKMTPVRPSRPMSSAWTQHSYWSANEFMESNVWDKFESGITGKQGLIKAKEESNRYFSKVKFGHTYKDVIEGDADVFIYQGSCIDLMGKMYKEYQESGCVDYIFTDPPYDSSIQYGELSYMWVAWLKKDHKYLENIEQDEIVHNEKQRKTFDVYHSLLRNSFVGMFNILKPTRYLTLTFHNPTFKVRNATIRAGVMAGFELEKIHHQELAHPSPKSLLQPFGSAQGDFYLRFFKPNLGTKSRTPEAIDDIRFDKIVVETTIMILAERGEPTPYTIIINAIDPELAKNGLFSELNSGLDVSEVLKRHIGKEFELVPAKIGATTGKLWWFKNPKQVANLEKIPLTERVEKTVLSRLQAKGKVTFTDMWDAVSIAFPNSLTSDQSNIREALETYARPMQEGYWLVKPNFRIEAIEKEHTTIIALLAEIGRRQGYYIYIGKNEQNHELNTALLKKTGKLNQYMDYKNVAKLKNIQNPDVVDDIDILWIKHDKIMLMFEVECSTSMTSALQRGSNIDSMVPKVMLYPVDRQNQFNQKMKSPLFGERFISDNWKTILFDVLYANWNKSKANIDIDKLLSVPTTMVTRKKGDKNQLNLF